MPTQTERETALAKKMTSRVDLPGGGSYEFSVHDVTWIDVDDLTAECQGQPQRYAFHARVHAVVKRKVREARNELARYLVSHAPTVREKLPKNATETQVKQEVAAQPGYAAIEKELERLEALEDEVGFVREALTQRRDMLQSLVMLAGPERGGDPAARAERDVKAGRYRPRR